MRQKGSKKKRVSASKQTFKGNKGQSSPPEPPAHLYKCKSIDDNHLEHSSRIFTHNELYFCASEDFNDPFDCKFQVSLRGPKSKIKQFSDMILQKHHPQLNQEERDKIFLQEGENVTQPEFEDATRDKMFQELKEWGICCLSEVRDDILMWSHYAGAHHGFCLKFSTKQGQVQFGVEFPTEIAIPLPVKYSRKYPIVNPIVGHATNETLLTKAEQWAYEREWRIIIPNSLGAHRFPPQCLTGIIFGCKMSNEHKDLIRSWCKNRQLAMRYYQARQSADSYRLHIDEIS